MRETDENWMYRAIGVAREAEKLGEVPVGAVIVGDDGKILAAASNRTITNTDPTAHAEILALRTAAIRMGNYRLTGVTVYSTIEPCAMCAGALVGARVARLVYGADDQRFGAVRSVMQICDNQALNHRIEIERGVLEEKCRTLMQDFFRAKRRAP
ncbi:MAG TPA: tRNA adenosine(34) deaminase TadA [Pyrinomonadaceae bacterium]|nr:tRNA adenosine(34) deaminase TadA [Pyrinomonadaceae bacterium]